MYEFLDRLVTIALPRVRDFRGLNPKRFDGRGNYALGIKEHIIFPEINYDKVESMLGMDIIVCTTAKTDDEARALAARLQLPVPAVSLQELRRGKPEAFDGKEKRNREQQAEAAAGEEVRRPAQAPARRSPTTTRTPMEERFEARLKLAELPRNGVADRASATAAR